MAVLVIWSRHVTSRTLVCGLALIVVGLSVGCGQDPSSSSLGTGTAASDQAQSLSVFSRDRTGRDEVPLRVAPSQGRAPTGALGNPVNEQSLQRSRKALPVETGTVYLIPANEAACALFIPNDGGGEPASVTNCVTPENLANKDPAPATAYTGCSVPDEEKPPVCERLVVFGVAPDGIVEAEVRLAGESVRANVGNNAYALELPGSARVEAVGFSAKE